MRLPIRLADGLYPTGPVAEVLRMGCPTCGRIYDRYAGLEPDGSVKMVCTGCSTAYWTDPPDSPYA